MKNQDLQLVTFEQAKRLEQEGFDWPCNSWYSEKLGNIHEEAAILNHNFAGGINAPTVSLALKWMRDVKDVRIGFSYGHYRESNIHAMGYAASGFLGDGTGKIIERCPSWESAESALLDELLTLLESK